MNNYKAYYESFGCQMNVFDTEVLEGMMLEYGFTRTPNPDEANVIIVNTCSVREKAEQRAIGRLNDLSRHTNALLAVCGCMAQRMGDRLFKVVPHLSLISGPDNYSSFPSTLLELLETGGKRVMTSMDSSVTYPLLAGIENRKVSRFLSITRGCENFCSYCIVPYLRGAVRSKDAAQIVREVNNLHEAGAREVTFLGQNVMAYNSGEYDFVSLIKKILSDTEVERVRFLTTHPRDISEDVFELMAADRRVCPHIHLPFQSGSNRILELMKRGYTNKNYLNIIERAREIKPDLAITTDIIYGFPSETESDFMETLELVEKGRFDSAFTFKYSPRKWTTAYNMADDVPPDIKKERLNRLNDMIKTIRKEIMEQQVGKIEEILLDGLVKKGENTFLKGRTPHFRNVLLKSGNLKPGDIVKIVIKELRNFTLVCEEKKRR